VDRSEFIALATRGAVDQVNSALKEYPGLASIRDAGGVSVIALTVYSGKLALAREIAAVRAELDIFEAACVGDVRRVESLAEATRESVNSVSPDGFSPLGFAAFFGHADLLESLIRQGADVNAPARNAMKVCPLHSAAAHSDQAKAVGLARSILASGAGPNATQQSGFAPIHEAALNGNVELVRLLLENGANPGLRNDEGLTAADLAQSQGHSEVASILGSHAA
jgi:ankyrin repeat protein